VDHFPGAAKVESGILPDDWLSGNDAELEAGEYGADPAG
jgi:hypothetical protein